MPQPAAKSWVCNNDEYLNLSKSQRYERYHRYPSFIHVDALLNDEVFFIFFQLPAQIWEQTKLHVIAHQSQTVYRFFTTFSVICLFIVLLDLLLHIPSLIRIITPRKHIASSIFFMLFIHTYTYHIILSIETMHKNTLCRRRFLRLLLALSRRRKKTMRPSVGNDKEPGWLKSLSILNKLSRDVVWRDSVVLV